MANSSLEQLKAYLKEMFQFDENDLDFGIYKILNLKRKEIEKFIDGKGKNELQGIVANTLKHIETETTSEEEDKLVSFIKERGTKVEENYLKDLESNKDNIKKFIDYAFPDNKEELFTALDNSIEYKTEADSQKYENKIYNYILNFFELYYSNGDFGYNDRSLAQYKVEYDEDYDGSDILFHWKHKDSYYIKTANDFNNVKFEVAGKQIEYRVESEGNGQATPQNNNKDIQFKHYEFVKTENKNGKFNVVFKLAEKSTSKVDIYSKALENIFDIKEDYEKYLYKRDGKPLFNDLVEKYDKINNGQLYGLSKLKLDTKKYFEHLAEREEFRDLGRNKTERVEKLKEDNVCLLLLKLDKNLNKFYIGNDADFFIHKDLKGFLTKEKEKFIKSVIFSDLNALFEADKDKNTLIIAKAFNTVVDRIIEFLASVEDFQKNLFTLKKKVIQTDYLISVDKIPQEFHKEILENKAQVKEFNDTFNVEFDDKLFNLQHYPTLVVDTKFFSQVFKDRLFSHKDFEDLDNKLTGLLVNSENFQALNLILEKYRKRIDTIFIDPPYNTGNDSFIYKDSFKNSSWLSMYTDRLILCKELMASKGVHLTSIGYNEIHNLAKIVSSHLDDTSKGNILIWKKKAGGSSDSKFLASDHDYIIFGIKSRNELSRFSMEYSAEQEENFDKEDDKGKYYLKSLIRSERLGPRPNLQYKIKCPDGTYLEFKPDGIKYTWVVSENSFNQMKEDGEIVFEKGSDNYWRVYRKVYLDTTIPRSLLLNIALNRNATTELRNLYNDTSIFSNPKPTALITHLLKFSTRRNSIVLDYFAGSGSTGDAVIQKNKKDNKNRNFLLIEMNQYFDTVLKERIKRIMFSENWKDGKPKLDKIDGYSGIVKYQRLEQYEDVLNNLQADNNGVTEGLPLKYLFRPQEKHLRSSLNLSKPFNNNIIYGKENIKGKVDIPETYCYLKGYSINSIKTYTINDKYYRVYHTYDNRLIIFRSIKDKEDDSDNINQIMKKYDDIDSFDINSNIDRRKFRSFNVHIITREDFDIGAEWS